MTVKIITKKDLLKELKKQTLKLYKLRKEEDYDEIRRTAYKIMEIAQHLKVMEWVKNN